LKGDHTQKKNQGQSDSLLFLSLLLLESRTAVDQVDEKYGVVQNYVESTTIVREDTTGSNPSVSVVAFHLDCEFEGLPQRLGMQSGVECVSGGEAGG
jgi:hypothetical protein